MQSNKIFRNNITVTVLYCKVNNSHFINFENSNWNNMSINIKREDKYKR